MAEQLPKNPPNPPGPKVSPVRTIVSLVLLLLVGAICLIELRAGLGQMMTGKAMAAKSEEGAFTNVTLEEAKGMLSLAPSESIKREDEYLTVYHYEWFSLLRPLMGEANPQLFLEASKSDPPMALSFHTSAEEDPILIPAGSGTTPPEMTGMAPPGGPMMGPPGMGSPGMGPGGGRGPGGGGGPGGGRQRPAVEGEAPATSETPSDAATTEPPSTTPAETTPETPAETPEPAKEGDAPATPEPAAPETPEPKPEP